MYFIILLFFGRPSDVHRNAVLGSATDDIRHVMPINLHICPLIVVGWLSVIIEMVAALCELGCKMCQ